MEFRLPEKILISLIFLIIVLSLTAGCILPGEGPSPASQTPPEMDAECSMQELNMTFFQAWTIVPITDEDLRPFPEFAIYIQDEDATSPALVRSFRPIKLFSCNESRAIRFIALSHKFGDILNPTVLEYHGHYYQLSSNSYFGTTARPTIREERIIASFGLDENNPDRTFFFKNPDLMESFLNESEADIDPYYTTDGPVVGYGRDKHGSIVVMMDEAQETNQTLVREIYDRISARGKTFHITSIPCKFVLMGIGRYKF